LYATTNAYLLIESFHCKYVPAFSDRQIFLCIKKKIASYFKLLYMRLQILVAPLIACCILAGCSSSKKAAGQKNVPPATVHHEMLDENTFKLTGISEDDTYGYSEKNAICVAGGFESGPRNERSYLNALIGPNGESISYQRLGSCCAIKSSNSPMGMAMLDIYEVKYDGIEKPVRLYLNMYDPGPLQAPRGFNYRK